MELESIRLEIHAALYFTDQLMEFARQKLSLKDLVLLFRTRVYKTRDLCGINNSNLACENRVFEPWVLDGNRANKTSDASLQYCFKTHDSLLYSLPQITSLLFPPQTLAKTLLQKTVSVYLFFASTTMAANLPFRNLLSLMQNRFLTGAVYVGTLGTWVLEFVVELES